MDTDDLDPRLGTGQKRLEKLDLEAMSLAALDEYIAELQGEITRAQNAIGKKDSARDAADAVFKI